MAYLHGFIGWVALDSVHRRRKHNGFSGEGAAVHPATRSRTNETLGSSEPSRSPEYAGAIRSLRNYRTCRYRYPRIDAGDSRVFNHLLWLRVAHAIGMTSGIARLPVRSMIYVAAWIVTLVFAWQVLSKAA